MNEKGDVPPRSSVEEELIGRVAWLIHLRWFAASGVLIGAWFASTILGIPLPRWQLYAASLFILAYNALFWLYLKRLEKDSVSEAAVFDQLAKLQTSVDWLTVILLVHWSGGIESPLLFYFIFHLIIASILLSPRACYLFATMAALAVGVLAILEYTGVLSHTSLGLVSTSAYQSVTYIASILVFFTTSLFISVYLATSVTINLRRKDQELLRLQQSLEDAYSHLQTVYEVTTAVSSTLDLDEVLNRIAEEATKAMQVKACTIRLLDESGQVVDTIASYGLSRQFLTKGPIDVQRSVITYQTLSGQMAIISDISEDERLQYAAEARAEGIHSMLCVPLLIRGKAEGVICVYAANVGRFSRSDAEFLSALGNASATAIENARAYKALEMADKAKSDFVRMLTHEFRSPLSAVQSMLRLLEQGFVGSLTAKQKDLIQRSQRRIGFTLDMVGDLLELAAGKMELLTAEKKPMDLCPVISRVTELMRPRAAEKEIGFEVELPEKPLALVGLEEGLERVVMNLVSNAIKYTPPGGSVAVRARSESDHIRLEVSDTGIGIPREALPRIFTEFYRAQNAKALDVEGTGLGLVIAKDVVEQHGGRIWVESTVGEGSTFYVTLPGSEGAKAKG